VVGPSLNRTKPAEILLERSRLRLTRAAVIGLGYVGMREFHARRLTKLLENTQRVDADLYSTTLYGLATVDSVLLAGIGSYVAVFDEFSSAADEYRAFRDYVAAFRRSYRVLGHVGRSFNQAAISIFTA